MCNLKLCKALLCLETPKMPDMQVFFAILSKDESPLNLCLYINAENTGQGSKDINIERTAGKSVIGKYS